MSLADETARFNDGKIIALDASPVSFDDHFQINSGTCFSRGDRPETGIYYAAKPM